MPKMILLSLLLNIVVLIPVCLGLIIEASWVDSAYGAESPARGILLSVYLAILLGSVALLFCPDPKLVISLLSIQVIYKLTTPFTVGMHNSVVVSNVLIALFHLVTIALLVRGGRLQ